MADLQQTSPAGDLGGRRSLLARDLVIDGADRLLWAMVASFSPPGLGRVATVGADRGEGRLPGRHRILAENGAMAQDHWR